MTNKIPLNPEDYIEPILMNGMHGRMLRMPAPKGKSREILFVYGMHASIERHFGFAEALNKFGAITMPDLPGHGGMDSFYKIGEKPSYDNLADYLAAFIKLKYRRKKVTILAMSQGFPIVTRMLQRSPELINKVELLVSVVGFVHHEEFVFSKKNYYIFRYGASILSNKLPSLFIKHFILRPKLIRATYMHFADKHVKMKDADDEERQKRINFEIKLWQINDIRTYMDTAVSMFKLDLVKEQVDLPVVHIAVKGDRYFDNHIVEQHLAVIYSKVKVIWASSKQHGPTVIATAKEANSLIPVQLRRILASKSSNLVHKKN